MNNGFVVFFAQHFQSGQRLLRHIHALYHLSIKVLITFISVSTMRTLTCSFPEKGGDSVDNDCTGSWERLHHVGESPSRVVLQVEVVLHPQKLDEGWHNLRMK